MADQDEIREWLKHVPYKLLAEEMGRRNNAKRKVNAGGRPKVMRACPKCGLELSAREMLSHPSQCSRR